jgi:hypothetical protein
MLYTREQLIKKCFTGFMLNQLADVHPDIAFGMIIDAALEEAAKIIEIACHDDMTREEEAAAIRKLKDPNPPVIELINTF